MATRSDGSAQRARRTAWVVWLTRRSRGLGSLTVSLALVLGAILLIGSNSPGQVDAKAGALVSAHPNIQTSHSTGKPLRIARADLHAEARINGDVVEINLSITQTQNDCLAPIKGGVCLRYSILSNEQGVLGGYGVIPASDIQVTPNRVVLKVDTSKVIGFHMSRGTPVVVDVTWVAAPGARIGAQQNSGAQGYIGPYSFSNLSNGALTSAGVVGAYGASVSDEGNMVATIIAG